MANKQKLGRGLSHLISSGSSAFAFSSVNKKESSTHKEEPVNASLLELKVDDIHPNPAQPRKNFDPSSLEELAESIRSEGLLQPIIVRKKKDGYELIAGERRLRACKLLNLKYIPAKIVDVSSESSALIALIENLQREDLNPIDEALGFAKLIADFNLTQELIAQRVGKSRASVANALRLLSLDSEVQGYIGKKLLTVGHAKVILSLEDKFHQLSLARKIIQLGLSVRATESALKLLKHQNKSEVTHSGIDQKSIQKAIFSVEKQITEFLGTKVRVKHAAKKGSILIEYYGSEDLDRILGKLGLQS